MALTRTAIRTLLAVSTAALLNACAGPSPVPPIGAEPGEPGDFPRGRYLGLPENSVFRVTASNLTLRVYRAGRLKQFGHNHVITSTAMQGLIHLPEQRSELSTAFANLYLPVTSLEVDDPDQRARAGEQFAAPVSAANRDGTRHNMLGPLVLDAANHPYIYLAVTPASESVAALDVMFKGAHYRLAAPVDWQRTNGTLSASTAFTLSHEAIGLRPFSILGGAIAVAEDIEVSMQLQAALTTFSRPGS